MRNTLLTLFILLFAVTISAADIKSGRDLVTAMHSKYSGKWYRTLTFIQKTTTYKPDGTSDVAIWYEAMTVPGKLRIDIAPLDMGNGMIFADGKIHSFRDGKLAGSRDLVHPLMVLGFDVYGQPVDKTLDQIRSLKIDLDTVHVAKWQGRDAYVVGAKPGDETTPQFWIDRKNLYFVRLIQRSGREGKSVSETQFNKYEQVKGGGWIAPEVKFFTDGRMTMLEEYTDVQANVSLAADLWDPEKWMLADKSYFQLKK
ncbi:MAG: hypothetical protein AB7J13_10725 [Pyrinomonadaceae bacterium]